MVFHEGFGVFFIFFMCFYVFLCQLSVPKQSNKEDENHWLNKTIYEMYVFA